MQTFLDRADAGRELATLLLNYKNTPCVVYGLPRGGVITAKEVARALRAPLDLIITRKIGHPLNREYAVGAVSEDGDAVFNQEELASLSPSWVEEQRAAQQDEARRRQAAYQQGRPPVDVKGKTAILIDDGIATGYSMEAAILSVKKRQPAKVVVATPIAPKATVDRFRKLADEVVVVESPAFLTAIGYWYDDFEPIEDDEVLDALNESVPA